MSLAAANASASPLARALILEPKVLILDEPTSALDRAVRAEFLKLLRQLQQDKGLAYIFISHDLPVVRSLVSRTAEAHHLLVMRQGEVIEQNFSGDIFTLIPNTVIPAIYWPAARL